MDQQIDQQAVMSSALRQRISDRPTESNRAWEAEEGVRRRTGRILMGDSVRRDLERQGSTAKRENGANTTNVNIPCQHVPDIC